MMIFKKQKTDKYARNFMILSVAAVFLFVVFVFIILPLIFDIKKTNKIILNDTYINHNYVDSDPLLTSVPKLHDIITGPTISNNDPILGKSLAPITITLYANFTCFFCGDTLATIKKIQNEFPDKVKIVHKDYPNKNKSFASYQAAIAGRCAQQQNKFWEIADSLYQNFNSLSRNTFIDIAHNLNLNIPDFVNCLDGKNTESIINVINDNIKEADALGIAGIPTVYINNHEMPADITYTELKKAVEQELRQ